MRFFATLSALAAMLGLTAANPTVMDTDAIRAEAEGFKLVMSQLSPAAFGRVAEERQELDRRQLDCVPNGCTCKPSAKTGDVSAITLSF